MLSSLPLKILAKAKLKEFLMKKLMIIISSFFSLSFAQASFIIPEPGLPIISLQKIDKLEKTIKGPASNDDDSLSTTKVSVYATVIFANPCRVPDSFVKLVEGDFEKGYRYTVFGVWSSAKTCPIAKNQVTQKILVDVIGTTDAIPRISVNGKKL